MPIGYCFDSPAVLYNRALRTRPNFVTTTRRDKTESLCQPSHSSPNKCPKKEAIGFPCDTHHGNSLFSDQVSAITFLAQGSDYTAPDFLGEVHDVEQVLGRGRTVRCDLCQFKRVGGLELEVPLVSNDGGVAGVRLYFDDAMPSVEAR